MASNLEPKINRIATAVTSALSALTAKGVTVPEGANVDSLASLIESIEAGGGGEIDFFPFKSILYGTYTPAEDVNSFSVPNPNNISGDNAFFVISQRGGTIGSNGVDSAVFQSMYNQIARMKYSTSGSTNNYPVTKGFASFDFGRYYLAAGVTYWYAYGVK